jgi:hypothetical protein
MSIASQRRVSSSRQGSEGLRDFDSSETKHLSEADSGASVRRLGHQRSFFAAADLLLGTDDDASVSWLTVWLIGWTCGGACLSYLWFWMRIGTEVVILRPATLLIRRELGGLDRSKEYDLLHVKNLRVASISGHSYDWSGAMHFLGIGGGPIDFDYGFKTVRFGSGVQDAEAREIVKELRSRYPFPEAASVRLT